MDGGQKTVPASNTSALAGNQRDHTVSRNHMRQNEKRRFIRYDSLHLLDYIVLDDEGQSGQYSMGRTIDVSLDGVKLETIYPLKEKTRLLLTIGLEEDLVDLEGITTHASPHNGRYISGVNFVKVTKDGRRIFNKYVEAFRQRKMDHDKNRSAA